MADFSALSHILVINYHTLPAYISFLVKYAIQKSNHERALTASRVMLICRERGWGLGMLGVGCWGGGRNQE